MADEVQAANTRRHDQGHPSERQSVQQSSFSVRNRHSWWVHVCCARSRTADDVTVEKPDYSEAKIVVAMVGLPARGKSYLSNRLMRYLRWLEYNVEVFNVGQLRRSKARAAQQA